MLLVHWSGNHAHRHTIRRQTAGYAFQQCPPLRRTHHPAIARDCAARGELVHEFQIIAQAIGASAETRPIWRPRSTGWHPS